MKNIQSRAQIAPVFYIKTVIFCQKKFYVKLFVKRR